MWQGQNLRILNIGNMVYLFSYGTLQLEQVQLETFGRLLKGDPDKLSGYKTRWLKILDEEVVRRSGETQHPMLKFTGMGTDLIEGTVFEITEVELSKADQYEVDDYRRIEVTMVSGKKAFVYIEK